ncbi:MAG: hypothetical protein AAB320_03965 [Elusimicrobiota bacterium]
MNIPLVSSLAAVVLGAALSVPVAVFAEDLSPTFDVSALLKQAKEGAAKDASVVSASYQGGSRYDSDCVKFTFGPNDGPVSDSVWLRSQEWVTECHPTGGDPRHGGGGQNCWDRRGYSYQEQVQITLAERKPLLPWETDSFRVCLTGPWIDSRTLAAAYEYRAASGSSRNGRLVMTPGRRTLMKPDAAGLSLELTAGMTLTLRDKWASYYAGEKILLKLSFKKDLPNWFDPTLVDLELTLPAAEAYAIDLKQYASQFSQKLEVGKNYYVDVSFQRLASRVSKDDVMKVGESAHVDYRPAAAAGVGR